LSEDEPDVRSAQLVRRHLVFGWWSLLAFLTLGIGLESLHALKVGWYLDVSNHTRRLMWTLAHAHATLLSLIHLAFGFTLATLTGGYRNWNRLASRCLVSAGVLIPGGFFLGGLVIYDGDPGVGILLLPIGALLLFGAVFLAARGVTLDQKS